MNYKSTLEKIENGELTSQEALNMLYPEKKQKKSKPGKRATFIKLKIHVPDEGQGVNTFLRILFALPIPLVFARLGLKLGKRFAKDVGDEVDFDEIARLIKYSKNTRVQVDAKDAQVDIRIM
jgi:hypothetical protein